jgi:hypothetical protein
VAELTGDLDTELAALQAGVQALAQLSRPNPLAGEPSRRHDAG